MTGAQQTVAGWVVEKLSNVKQVAAGIWPPRDEILALTAAAYGVTVADLTGRQRARRFSRPRHVAMWLAQHFGYSTRQIGASLGDRDHATVIYGIRRANTLRAKYPGICRDSDALLAKLTR